MNLELDPRRQTCTRREPRKAHSLFGYTYEDVEVVGYQHHPVLRAPVAV